MKNANKPAQPLINAEDSEVTEVHYGFTKREVIAKDILVAILKARGGNPISNEKINYCGIAIAYADELLTQLDE